MDSFKELFHFLTDVEGMIRWGGYVALAIIVFTETGLMIGFFLPGDSLLVTAGLFAARGDLNIVWLNLLLITMAILGDATGYFIGKKLGPALFRRKDSRLFKKEHLVRTQLFYEKHGGKTIIIARFVPIIRTFAPVVAGIAQMHYRRFAAFNIFGGIGWVVSMTMVGYILGRFVPNIDKYIEIVIIVVIFLSLLPGFIEHWRAKKAARSAAEALREKVRTLLAELLAGSRREGIVTESAEPATLTEAGRHALAWEFERMYAIARQTIDESVGSEGSETVRDTVRETTWSGTERPITLRVDEGAREVMRLVVTAGQLIPEALQQR